MNKVIIFEGSPTCIGDCKDWCGRTKWIITDNYIESQNGLCCQEIDTCELIRVKDMSYKGICCCGSCGTITLNTSDETTPILVIKGIPGVKSVYEKLRNAVDAKTKSARIELQQ